MKRLTASLLLAFISVFGIAVLAPSPAAAGSTSKEAVCIGANAASGAAGGCTDTSSDLNNIIEVAISLFSVIIGIIAVVMIVYGGFKYITAAGDSSKLQSAKHTIVYALIGLVIVAFAQFIVQFVLDKAT